MKESGFTSTKLCKIMTQCKIEFTYASHCDSKNLMPRRMLKKDLLISKLKSNAGTIEFFFEKLEKLLDPVLVA